MIAVLLLSLLYLIWMIQLRMNWKKSTALTPLPHSASQSLSILIPFRNESPELIQLCEIIQSQLAANGSEELILIDDHSENDLIDSLRHRFKADARIHILNCEETEMGKKAALKRGVNKSGKKWLAQLDADVIIDSEWIFGVRQAIQSEATMILLPVMTKDHTGFLPGLERCELLAIMGLTASTALSGKAVMANGANLIVETELMRSYLASEEGLKFSSGDDQFLLNHAHRHKQVVAFHKDERCIARTKAASSPKAFIHQRLRWAGKMGKSSGLTGQKSGIMVALFQLGFALGLPLALSGNILFFLGVWLLKAGAEYLLLHPVSGFFGNRKGLILSVPIQSLIYPYASICIALASQVYQPRWKGRKIANG